MKLIVGLGNPDRKYSKTRHNIGFMMLDAMTDSLKLSFKNKDGGLFAETVIKGQKIIFLKPQNYINLSGQVIRRYLDFYKLSIDDILVIHDDLDLEVGKYKLKHSGSSAGHNGLKDIERCLGTKHYRRMKIGISNNKNVDTKDYVLSKFKKDEKVLLNQIFEIGPELVVDYLELSFDNLMNKYNKR
jgi:PTH1 family peptidyl-tRNA hydrolase